MKTHLSNTWFAVLCALVVLSALVGGFLTPALNGGLRTAAGLCQPQNALYYLGVCMLTAVVEETIFRFALMRGAVHLGCSWRRAAFISAVIFGLFHLGLPTSDIANNSVAWAQCVLKILQGCAFGYALAVLYAHLGKLWVCILLHFAFDALYFAPYFSEYSAFPATYTTGVTADLAGLACSLALLVAAAIIAWVSWKRA